jgi:hypothetical protein
VDPGHRSWGRFWDDLYRYVALHYIGEFHGSPFPHDDILIYISITGVAFSCAPEWLPPKTIQRWPGKLPGELSNKVPTCIEYDIQSGSVKNWGFKCDQEDGNVDIKEFFKLHLAPQYYDDFPGSPSRQDAQRWFQDYIQCIYRHVISHFNTTIPQFSSRKVEFLFSVPTTWKDVRMVEETRRLLERAINANTPNHRVSVGLTEAEAAAVYAGNEHYQVRIKCILFARLLWLTGRNRDLAG